MAEKDPVDQQDVVDGTWWRDAERRARKQHRAVSLRASLRRPLGWAVPAVVLVLGLGAVIAAIVYVNGGALPQLLWRTADEENVEGAVRLLPEALEGDPFTGTPAEAYSSDVDGIVAPPARALGRHSSADVGRALATTKRLLVLAHLDHRALVGRDPKPYLSGLAPTMRESLQADPGLGVSMLAPGQQLLAPPRVRGTMTPALGKQGEITIVTKYVFVYALRPALPVDERSDTHVIVRADATFAFYAGERFAPDDRGVWILDSRSHWMNISCDQAEKGLLALPKLTELSSGAVEGADVAGTDARRYAVDTPFPTDDDCG